MSAKRTEIRDIPGLISGRISAGILAGAGVIWSGVLDFASVPTALEFGMAGIYAAGVSVVVAGTVTRVKNNAKLLTMREMDGATVELDTKDVAKVFFGLPAKQKRIYVNKGGMASGRAKALHGNFNRLIPSTSTFVANLPEAKTFEEINNYIVMKNGRVYIEKIITPTSLTIWDNAFKQAGGTVTWEQARPVRTVEDGLKSIINGFFK